MRRTSAALILVVTMVLAAACTDDDGPPGDRAAPEADGAGAAPASCDPATEDALAAWANAGFSGTIAVTAGGVPDCLAAFGVADPAAGTPVAVDTVFAVGSVSKAFTAAAVFALVDDGDLALDDRAGDLVPDLRGPVADATVEQLLLHTSGLSGSHGADHEPLTRDEAVAAIGGLDLAFPPGTRYLYSNAGYTLLAVIVEQISGIDHRSVMAERVLTLPDGEVAGGFWDGEPAAPGPRAVGRLEDGSPGQRGDFAGPHWALAGNGDLAMTTRGLAAWTHALFTGGVVSRESAAAIAAPGFDHGDGTAETPGWVAVGAAGFGEAALVATGGGGDVGHDVAVAWIPQSERVVAIASNTPDVRAGDLLRTIGPALATGGELPPPRAAAAEIDPDELAALAGAYELESGGAFVVEPDEDRLTVTARGGAAVAALFPLPDGVPAGDVAAHEDDVRALLAGETAAGSEELAAVESDLGPLTDVEVVGTVVENGELRTYVTVTAGGEAHTGWYALDDGGGIVGVDLAAGSPALAVAPAGSGVFRPVDPAGTGPGVALVFRGGRLTVIGPAGAVEAPRATRATAPGVPG